MSDPGKYIGQPLSRVDGPLKVTGQAKYAGDFNVPDLLYGYVLNSTIAAGKIIGIDAVAARAVPGVVKVYTHENRPDTAWLNIKYTDMDAPPGVPLKPLHDEKIKYNGQPVALVVATTFELARYAASLIHIEYKQEVSATDLQANLGEARKPKKGLASFLKPGPPKPKGDAEKAFAESDVKAAGRFVHGIEHHNPMELFASTVVFGEDGKLTIYDKTQGVINSQLYVADVFGKAFKDVRVISPFVGGAFGSGLRPQYQLFLAVLAALDLKRSVRVTLNRHQMFTFGHRPATIQNTRFGATGGKLTALLHDAVGETSCYEDYTEIVVNWSHLLYPAPNVKLDYHLVPLNLASPMDMRAPGGVTGLHPIECTIDELAYKAGIDPVEFRLINYGEIDESEGKPHSSKELKACFAQGAERFGWSGRSHEPRSLRRGHRLVGWGMATGIWEAMQMPARAEAVLTPDGRLTVCSATADIGTGTYTVMTQIAADCMGMDIAHVKFELGDSRMPFAPIEGGSFTAATVGTAVQVACRGLRVKIFQAAKKSHSDTFGDLDLENVEFNGDYIRPKNTPASGVRLKDVVLATKKKDLRSKNWGRPHVMKQRKYSRNTHSAVFVEVEVDEDFGTVKVTRMVTAVAAGKILNPKTARSQILGGMVWGLSKALREEAIMDHRYGRFVNQNLAEYHTPVHADIPELEVIFVPEEDNIVNDLGIKGLGEIGVVGVAPAIANAVFHATGKRIRDLPITLDKLLSTE